MRLSSAEVVFQKVDVLLVKCSPKANKAFGEGDWGLEWIKQAFYISIINTVLFMILKLELLAAEF